MNRAVSSATATSAVRLFSSMRPCGWRAAAACHEPHGSANPRMLVRHEQSLVCLECHANISCPSAQNAKIGGVPPAFHDLQNFAVSKLHRLSREGSRIVRGSRAAAMRLLATFLILIPLAAQQPTTPVPQPADAPPQTSGDNWLQGSIELGYRWIPGGIDGNFDAYRSVVNLGQGPKLLDADFTLLNPSKILFDRADVHATSWGGDPYNTLRVDVQKDKIYRLTADYRNIAYFNFLPSYADPSITQGVELNQNAYDTAIRTLNIQLDLLPGKWISPYIAFGRNTQFGSGITEFYTDQNNYAVASLYSDQTNDYRAGVRMELGRYHVTVEARRHDL